MNQQELEACVLSGLLRGGASPDAFDVIAVTPEEAFSLRFYQDTYREIKKQALGHGVIDTMLVSEALGADSLPLLMDVTRMPGTLPNLKGFANILAKRWRSGKMAQLLQDSAEAIRGARNQEQRDEVIQTAVSALIDMTSDTGNVQPVRMGDLIDDYIDLLDKRLNGTIATPNLMSEIAELDSITGGFNPTDLVVIAGRPGMGKTEFALKVVEGATRKGGGALIFSMEMSSQQMVERSVAAAGNLPVSKLRKPIEMCDEDWARINAALGTLKDRDIWIVDATDLTVDQISAVAETHKRRYPNLCMTMVDYLGLIKKPTAERNDLAVGHISRSLKTLAMRTHTPCFALSQLSRKVDERPAGNRRPIMSDLRDSGSIEQDADSIILLYREAVYNPESPAARYAEVIVGKNRFGENGVVYQEFKNGHFLDTDHEVAKEATRITREAHKPKPVRNQQLKAPF